MKLATVLVITFLFGVSHCEYTHEGGLTTIARGSANQAHSAVSNQFAAAQRASYVAKSTLAQQATQAAATAQAALAGKYVLLKNLEKQKAKAQVNANEELSQLQSMEKLAATSSSTAHMASKHAAVLKGALENAESLAQQADIAATHAAQELGSQNSMVALAKATLHDIEHRLEASRIDYLETKEATQKAVDFAQKAQHNAAAAEAYAVIKVQPSNKPAGLFGNEEPSYFH